MSRAASWIRWANNMISTSLLPSKPLKSAHTSSLSISLHPVTSLALYLTQQMVHSVSVWLIITLCTRSIDSLCEHISHQILWAKALLTALETRISPMATTITTRGLRLTSMRMKKMKFRMKIQCQMLHIWAPSNLWIARLIILTQPSTSLEKSFKPFIWIKE